MLSSDDAEQLQSVPATRSMSRFERRSKGWQTGMSISLRSHMRSRSSFSGRTNWRAAAKQVSGLLLHFSSTANTVTRLNTRKNEGDYPR